MMIKEIVLTPFIHHVHDFPDEGLAIGIDGKLYFVDHEDYGKFVNKVLELGFEGTEEHKLEAYRRGEDVNWD